MVHSHEHKANNNQGRKLLWATLLNLIITIVEILGGIFSNSISLLSDALHNLGDTLAVFIAYLANLVSRKESNYKKTFGYKRLEILAALFNATVLLAITIFLFIEAGKRLVDPEEIHGKIMFIVASIGLLANLAAVLMLKKDTHSSLNIRAAYLHLLGDTFSSLAVIAGSLCIIYFKVYWIDAVVTFLVGLFLLKETIVILKQTIDILMQGTPKGIDLEKIQTAIESLPGIDNIHHVHVWNLNDQQIHFESHVNLKEDIKVSKTKELTYKIEDLLQNKFGINHVTLQYGHFCCDDKNIIHKQ
jgi:cobalt-zinc-cadmium efflux system protein